MLEFAARLPETPGESISDLRLSFTEHDDPATLVK